jgi:hypothetical protein
MKMVLFNIGVHNAARILAIAAMLSGCSQYPYATKFSETDYVRVQPGQQTRVGRYSVWDTFCGSLTFSNIVNSRPAHGTVIEKRESWTVTNRRVGSVDCTGKTVQGTAVYYTSEQGYHGLDQIGIWIQSNNTGGIRDTIMIDVH